MSDDKTRQALVHFVNRKILDPVLKASPDKYSAAEQKTLERLKQKTEAQKQRYADYASAREVRERFQDDLSSAPAKKVHADLQKLNLPSQPDFKEEFLALAERLGVTSGKKPSRKTKSTAKRAPAKQKSSRSSASGASRTAPIKAAKKKTTPRKRT